MMDRPESSWWPFPLIVALAGLAHLFASPWGEPFKNNDETRHVMTGVFFHDAIKDGLTFVHDPKGYASQYYTQYPALGLLVWPPLFYILEGLVMLVLGPTYFTARVVLSFFVILAAYYQYRSVGERFGTRIAVLATGLFLLSPFVFDFSRYCMLEVPTLALVLGCVYHFERYLNEQRSRDAWFACLLAAAATLTRFDGVILLPYIGLRLLMTRSWACLLNKPVLWSIIVALMLTGPYYALTWVEYRSGLQGAALRGTSQDSTGFLAPENAYLYISYIPQLMGLSLTIISIYGIYQTWVNSIANTGRLFILIIATYITFVPFAEPEPRHAIYWVPTWCTLAAIGLVQFRKSTGTIFGWLGLVLVLASTAWDSLAARGTYFRGYEDAAKYCKSHQTTDRPWFCDGTLTGGFIFQVRQRDADRMIRVLRGDKLLYAVLSDPNGRYDEFAHNDQAVLDILHDYDPEFVIVENPPLLQDTPASARLRQVLPSHPELYERVWYQQIDTNHYWYIGKQLEIWRKLRRNPNPRQDLSLPVLGLGKSIRKP